MDASFNNLNQAEGQLNNLQSDINNGLNSLNSGNLNEATNQLNNINARYENLVNDIKNNNIYDSLQDKISQTNQMLEEFKNKTQQSLNIQKQSVSNIAESLPQIISMFRQMQEAIENVTSKLSNADTNGLNNFKNEIGNIKKSFDELLEMPLLDETKIQQSANKISETYEQSLKSAFSMADIGKDLILESVKNNQNEIANEIKKVLLDTSTIISNVSSNVQNSKGNNSSIGSMDAITFNRLITDIIVNKINEKNKVASDEIISKIDALINNNGTNSDSNELEYLETLKNAVNEFIQYEKQGSEIVNDINSNNGDRSTLTEDLRQVISDMIMATQNITAIISASSGLNGVGDINGNVLSRIQNYNSNLNSISEVSDLIEKLNNIMNTDKKGFILIDDKNLENLNLINLGLDQLLGNLNSSNTSNTILQAFENADIEGVINKKLSNIKLNNMSGNFGQENMVNNMSNMGDESSPTNFIDVLFNLDKQNIIKAKFNNKRNIDNRKSALSSLGKAADNLDKMDKNIINGDIDLSTMLRMLSTGYKKEDNEALRDRMLDIKNKNGDKEAKGKEINDLLDKYSNLHKKFESSKDAEERNGLESEIRETEKKIAGALNDVAIIQKNILDLLNNGDIDKLKDTATRTGDKNLADAVKGIDKSTKDMFVSTEALFKLQEMFGDENSKEFEELNKAFKLTNDKLFNNMLSSSAGSSLISALGKDGGSGGGGIINTIRAVGGSFIDGIKNTGKLINNLIGINLSISSLFEGTVKYYKDFAKMDVRSAKAQLQQGNTVNQSILDANRRNGIDIYAATHGVVGFEEYEKMSSSLISQVQGHTGGSDAAGLQDMMSFVPQALLMEQVYDVNSRSAINTFYKELGKSASDTEDFMYKLVSTAQASNIPVSQYVSTMENLGKQFKELGINVNIAENAMANLTTAGMTLNTAQGMVSNFGSALNSFSNDWGQTSFYGVMSGQYSDPWQAGWEAVNRWDENGNVREGADEKLARSYQTKLDITRAITGGNQDVANTMMVKTLQSDGFTQQNAVTMVNKLNSGDLEGITDLLTQQEETKNKIKLEGQDDLEEKLLAFSSKTDELTKAQISYEKTQMELANIGKDLLDTVGKGLQNALSFFGGVLISAGNLIAKVTNTFAKFLNFGADHPIMTILGMIAARMGLNAVGKTATKFIASKIGGSAISGVASTVGKAGATKAAGSAVANGAKGVLGGMAQFSNKIPLIGGIISGGLTGIYDYAFEGTTLGYAVSDAIGTGVGGTLGGIAGGAVGTAAGGPVGTGIGMIVGGTAGSIGGGKAGTSLYTSLGGSKYRDGYGDNEEEQKTNDYYSKQISLNSESNDINKQANDQSRDGYKNIIDSQKTGNDIQTDINSNLGKSLDAQEDIKSLIGELNGNIKNGLATSYASNDLKAGGRKTTIATELNTESEYSDLIEAAGKKYGLDVNLLYAIMQAESGGDASAVSSVGAQGLMQLMPGTSAGIAKEMGLTNYDVFDPETNINMSAYYLKQLLDNNGYRSAGTDAGMYGDLLAAYNWGPSAYNNSGLRGNVEAGDFTKLPGETKAYLNKILGMMYGDSFESYDFSEDIQRGRDEVAAQQAAAKEVAEKEAAKSSSSSNSDQQYSLAQVYKIGSKEYSNGISNYDADLYYNSDNVGKLNDMQGFARDSILNYNADQVDKYGKVIESTKEAIKQVRSGKPKFEITISAGGSDEAAQQYIRDIQQSVSNLTSQFFDDSNMISTTINTINNSNY